MLRHRENDWLNETLEWYLRAKPLTTTAQSVSLPNRQKAQTQSSKVKRKRWKKEVCLNNVITISWEVKKADSSHIKYIAVFWGFNVEMRMQCLLFKTSILCLLYGTDCWNTVNLLVAIHFSFDIHLIDWWCMYWMNNEKTLTFLFIILRL